MADAGLEPCLGTGGDSYDNLLRETMIVLFKAATVKTKFAHKEINLEKKYQAELSDSVIYNVFHLRRHIGAPYCETVHSRSPTTP